MHRRPLLAAAGAIACALLSAAPALAADVNIVSKAVGFSPRDITVAPGDTVTWHWIGSANERNHSPASDPGQLESWDADPGNPKPDFDHGAGHTFTTAALTHSGTFTYHCKVHPDVMRGTVTVTGAPVPAFTASASSAFAGDQVDFDATASSDPDGTIDRYEWDLDGNGSFETDTGATPSASRTYLAPASVNVGLRVTDDRGNQRTVSHPLTVATRAPTATFTVVPGTAAKGATVTFDASLSSATPGRTITDFAWDLDGDGTFETDTGLIPTATRSYTAAATLSIGLQVTDSAGDVTTTSRPLTVSNAAPTATFTVSNANPQPGATVTFDAASSTDSDGSIAKFTWDLDGNGSFETDTGTTPTASRAYTTPGATTVRLRVTDNENGTAETTRTVTVPAPPAPASPPASPPAPAPALVAPAPAPPLAAPPAAPPTARPAAVAPAAPAAPAAKKAKKRPRCVTKKQKRTRACKALKKKKKKRRH